MGERRSGQSAALGAGCIRGATAVAGTMRRGIAEAGEGTSTGMGQLQAVTAALSEAITTTDVVAAILDHATGTLGAMAATVVAVDPVGDELVRLGHVGYPADFMEAHARIPLTTPTTLTEAVRTGLPIILSSIAERDSRFPAVADLRRRGGERALVALPLRVRGRAIGAIAISFADERPFAAAERALFLMLAQQCAVALERARLYDVEGRAREAAERAALRTARLQAVTAALSEAPTRAEVARIIVEQGAVAVGARAGTLALLTDHGEGLYVAALNGYPAAGSADVGHRAPRAGLWLDEAVWGRRPLWVESVAAAPVGGGVAALADAGDRAWAALPLLHRGRAIGGLLFGFAEERAFDTDDRAFMLNLAQQCAGALERARLYEAERAAHAAAETAQARLRQILEVLPEGLLIADAEGRVALGNSAAAQLIGADLTGTTLPTDEDGGAFGTRRADGSPYPSRELPLQRAALRGETIAGEQLILRSGADGRDVTLLVNSAPLRAPDGTLLGGVAAFQDIAWIAELERERETFLAAITHDLKNPLTVIRGQAQIAQIQAARKIGDPATLATRLATIVATTGRMTAMLDQLLDSARLGMGQQLQLDRQPVDLVTLAGRAVAACAPSAAPGQVRLVAGVPDLAAEADLPRLERVLDNLLTNAIKFTPDGGAITLSVARERSEGRDWAVLTVRDRGIGIPASDLPHLFERFRRGSNVVGRIKGTGLGLANARQIVEAHGGAIGVASEEGRGTTVTVRLPVDEEEGGA